MKQCPYCAEESQDEAFKCKHCGELLNTSIQTNRAVSTSHIPWYFSKVFIIIMLLSIGPLALPLIWLHPTTSVKWKIGITAITLAITYGLYILSVIALEKLNEMYEALSGLNP